MRERSDGRFERSLAEERPWALRRAYAIVRDLDDAEDVVQGALLRAYLNRERFDWRKPLRSWLGVIVTNAAIDAMRVRARRVRQVEFIEGARPFESAEATVVRYSEAGDARALVEALRPPQRTALALYCYEDLPYDEIAIHMQLPINTVKTHIARGRRRLRSLATAPGV